MGYALMIGTCYACKRTMTFNPVRVPSYNNEPFCRSCIERANVIRVEKGMEPINIHPEAYTACREEEL